MLATELIKETVAYYAENPRSVGGYKCQYLSEEGAMCAVGRCLDWRHKSKILRFNDGGFDTLKFNNAAIFKKKYRGFPDSLWVDLQTLHDSSSCWRPDGSLTISGEAKVQFLLERYGQHEA